MSDGGISVPGGLGGVGGGGEQKVLKGLSDVGGASETDVTKFTATYSGEGGLGKANTEGMHVTMEEGGGPFAIQKNTTKNLDNILKPGIGHVILSEGQKIIAIGNSQEEAIRAQIKNAGVDGKFSQGEMFEIQFNIGNNTLFMETVAKGVNKTVQNVTTAVKNQ